VRCARAFDRDRARQNGPLREGDGLLHCSYTCVGLAFLRGLWTNAMVIGADVTQTTDRELAASNPFQFRTGAMVT
jgi:hypothetical protein